MRKRTACASIEASRNWQGRKLARFTGARPSSGVPDRMRPLSRSILPIGSPGNLSVQAEDKLIDFDAGRPGCGHLCKSPLSRLLGAFCLNSEGTSALHKVGAV